MHFQKVNKSIWSLIFIIGLIEITGIDSLEKNNQKGKQDVASTEFDYSDEGEPPEAAPTNEVESGPMPYFENDVQVVYATHEGENITIKCMPKNFNTNKHLLMWYTGDSLIHLGNNTLMPDKFYVDKNNALTIYNYNSTNTGTIKCEIQPGKVSQLIKVEIKAPDNLSEINAATSNALNYFHTFVVVLTTLSTLCRLY
ncbi:uncharacterized protein LOC142241804 [Haematobia irritans]|uniref:uncharacterized protein LOC142241804 n=1 Tax=Haematobia irritans TaxID=7368 RepID=UPI003F4FA5B7